jgi:hypothetical protein
MKNNIATKIKLATCTMALPILLSTNIAFADNIEVRDLSKELKY